MASFSATVSVWAMQSQERIDAVFKESTQRVIEEMLRPVGAGGNMPVDTGFLRASFIATINQPITTLTFRPDGDGVYSPDLGQTALVIAGADAGDTIFGSFTASYARIQEEKRAFLRLAAQRWPAIVAEVDAEARARVR